MGKFSDIFQALEPLECCEFKTLNRKVGLRVGYPHYNEGNQAISCEISYEVPTVNTSSFGTNRPLAELNNKGIAQCNAAIAQLDTIISELNDHRSRMIEVRESLDTGKIDLEAMASAHYAQYHGEQTA